MNREQLERLGEAGLRQMARRLGLRGARQLERSLLITGLAAYFARCPSDEPEPEDEAEVDADPVAGAAEFPPALTTETMARLLESQGKVAHATALRARLASGAAPVLATSAVHVERGEQDRIHLVWEGAGGSHPGLVVRLWADAKRPTQWELPVTTTEGRMQFDPPPDTTRLCAAVGQLSPDGFVPAARSSVIDLIPKKRTP